MILILSLFSPKGSAAEGPRMPGGPGHQEPRDSGFQVKLLFIFQQTKFKNEYLEVIMFVGTFICPSMWSELILVFSIVLCCGGVLIPYPKLFRQAGLRK